MYFTTPWSPGTDFWLNRSRQFRSCTDEWQVWIIVLSQAILCLIVEKGSFLRNRWETSQAATNRLPAAHKHSIFNALQDRVALGMVIPNETQLPVPHFYTVWQLLLGPHWNIQIMDLEISKFGRLRDAEIIKPFSHLDVLLLFWNTSRTTGKTLVDQTFILSPSCDRALSTPMTSVSSHCLGKTLQEAALFKVKETTTTALLNQYQWRGPWRKAI